MSDIKKICKISGKEFVITDRDQAFYAKMQVPPPEICHEERLRRRLMFRNARTLYKRKCDRTGKPIIAMYDADSPFPVYHRDEWWKDDWMPAEQEFDFSRPFFEQFGELKKKCPRSSVFNKKAYGSDYCNISDGLKDCYLSFVSFESRNLMYCHRLFKSNDCVDFYYGTNCQQCYDCVYCFDSFRLINCVEARNCTDSAFLYDCLGCKHCFMCTNLRQKEYYIFNEPHTKEEYEKKMQQVNLGSYATMQWLKKKFEDFRTANAIYRSNKLDQCEGSAGHRLFNCKDVELAFEVEDARDVMRVIDSTQVKDCADSCCFGGIHQQCELGYEVQESCDFYNFKFTNFCYSKDNLEYCDECHNCSNCFGCAGLKNESYRIFNKKYGEKEYHELKAKIIEHMQKTGEYGQFFPPELSPFAYNETEAYEYFPMEKEEVLRKGWRWKDNMPSAEGVVVDSLGIPDDIKDIKEDICSKALECEITGKKYAITEHELLFYKQNRLPVPRRSPNQRHLDRIKNRFSVHLYDRPCTKCGAALRSAYPADEQRRVYCDKCYFEAVY